MSRRAAHEHGLDLVDYDELKVRIAGREALVQKEEIQVQAESTSNTGSTSRKKRIFVAMPFSKEFDDVFFLGIQDVGRILGLVVERADLVEHSFAVHLAVPNAKLGAEWIATPYS